MFTQGNYSRTNGVSRRSASSPLRGLESAGATPGSQTPRHLDLDALWRVFRPRLDWKSVHAQGAPEAESDPRKEVKSAILSIYRLCGLFTEKHGQLRTAKKLNIYWELLSAPSETRTPDPLIKSQLLYQLS